MPESAKVVLKETKYLGGLAMLENAREETARVEIVDRDDVLAREPELLNEARGLMGRLPFPSLDVLVVCEMGKNYSGCGIDLNVVGRFLVESRARPRNERPCITRSPPSTFRRKATATASASVWQMSCPQRLPDPIDTRSREPNVMTARCLWRAKKPFAFPRHRACLEAAIATCWQPDFEKVAFAVIPNSLEVAEIGRV